MEIWLLCFIKYKILTEMPVDQNFSTKFDKHCNNIFNMKYHL